MKSTPQPFYIPLDRRRFIKSLALASAGFAIPGYLADLAMLDRNIFDIAPEEIRDVRVSMTIVGGKIVAGSQP